MYQRRYTTHNHTLTNIKKQTKEMRGERINQAGGRKCKKKKKRSKQRRRAYRTEHKTTINRHKQTARVR